ncbi:hypothetical protein [Demequina sp.]|uniref:hypothetical protein n=1 Tax=Demequina sp. TaxID=2050685 RepID=UPI003A836938
MTTNIEQLLEQQRALAKQIRDAKRAAKAKQRAAIVAAQNALGVRIAQAMDATTPEQIAALGDVLASDKVRRLAQQLDTESVTEASTEEVASSASSATDYGTQTGAVEGGDQDARSY